MRLHEAESPNARRVWIFMKEKGIDIERVPVDIRAGENLTPEYRAKNPMGRVPVLELDDGRFLAESVAICRYLESLHPDPTLFGEDGWEVASIEMWNRRAEINFAMNAASAFRNITGFFKDRETCVPEWGQVCAEEAKSQLGVFEDQLGTSDYLAGDRFSIADISMGVFYGFAGMIEKMAQVDFELDRPNLKRWYELVSKRSSFS
ncbi:MAG: glutathione S-transferase family protein [Polyangiaceae bacterium]